MRSSDPLAGKPMLRLAAYGLAGALALGELVIFARALSPDVPADYRAYFVDRTTTCRDQPVAGDYALGETVSFRPDGKAASLSIRVCGWDGPAGDGTHSVGDTSMIRVRRPEATALELTLSMVGIIRPPGVRQRVLISLNGIQAGVVELTDGEERAHTLRVPEAAMAGDMLTIELRYPDAHLPAPRITETQKRAIKLTAFRLAPA